MKEASSAGVHDKASKTGGTSRFSRFGFGSQLLQKTVGLVLKPRQGKQVFNLVHFYDKNVLKDYLLVKLNFYCFGVSHV